MIPKGLLIAWSFMLVCLVAAGAVSVALSLVWGLSNDAITTMIISHADTTAGLIMGISFLATSLLAIGAILTPNYHTFTLHLLNWVLVGLGIETVSIGTFIWFYTLTERADFDQIWLASSQTFQTELQETFQCCGYFNGTDHAVNVLSCADLTIAANTTGCVTPITALADVTLNNIFSTVYGFMFIVILFFLATACVINERMVVERFKKIDQKRGGKGFV